MSAVQDTVERVRSIDVDQYKYGFETIIESEKAPKGLDESTIRFISAKKNEPEWMLEWRLEAFRRWLTMREPTWARVHYPKIDFQDLYYYSAPTKTPGPKSLDEVDPELLRTYEKLGIPLREQEILAGVEREDGSTPSRVAVDAVFDSVSVVTTFKEELKKAGIIFGAIVAVVSCQKGMSTQGGPTGVANSVNAAVVESILILMVVNVAASQLYIMLFPRVGL